MVEEQLIRLIASRFALFYFWSGVKVFHGDAISSILTYSTEECLFFFYFQGELWRRGWGLLAIFRLFYLLVIRCQKKETRKRKGCWKLCCVRFLIHSSFLEKTSVCISTIL